MCFYVLNKNTLNDPGYVFNFIKFYIMFGEVITWNSFQFPQTFPVLYCALDHQLSSESVVLIVLLQQVYHNFRK